MHDCMTTGSTEWGGMAWMALYPALRSVVLPCGFDFVFFRLPAASAASFALRSYRAAVGGAPR